MACIFFLLGLSVFCALYSYLDYFTFSSQPLLHQESHMKKNTNAPDCDLKTVSRPPCSRITSGLGKFGPGDDGVAEWRK